MDRTCYFCEKLSPYDCKKHLDVSYLPNQYEYEARKCDTFTPNADWLEYEGLLQRIIELEIGEKLMEKEYESLKKELAELTEKVKIPKFAIIGANGLECLDPICEHCANIEKRQLKKENEELKKENSKLKEGEVK
ncbi:MAG: hypothetical protein WC319_15430 [Candidatus Paceibacterota bacterium]|jgi:hypothetical protein